MVFSIDVDDQSDLYNFKYYNKSKELARNTERVYKKVRQLIQGSTRKKAQHALAHRNSYGTQTHLSADLHRTICLVFGKEGVEDGGWL